VIFTNIEGIAEALFLPDMAVVPPMKEETARETVAA
jgi:hypothetical protein